MPSKVTFSLCISVSFCFCSFLMVAFRSSVYTSRRLSPFALQRQHTPFSCSAFSFCLATIIPCPLRAPPPFLRPLVRRQQRVHAICRTFETHGPNICKTRATAEQNHCPFQQTNNWRAITIRHTHSPVNAAMP